MSLEVALVHPPEAALPLRQEPGQVQGRALQVRVVGPQSGQEMFHRLALVPELQLARPLEVA